MDRSFSAFVDEFYSESPVLFVLLCLNPAFLFLSFILWHREVNRENDDGVDAFGADDSDGGPDRF